MLTAKRLLGGALSAALVLGAGATGGGVDAALGGGYSLTPIAQAADPALVQNVGGDEAVIPLGNPVTISQGHIDIGPFIDNGEFTLLFRDDSQNPPVWRHLEDAVFVLDDNARQTIPGGDDYSFTGAREGDDVWAIPQNQQAGVPWLGWNIQSPTITSELSRGVNFTFGPHRGPGVASLFLQSGGFGGPQVLYSSADSDKQGMWVEMNTHTHANWVFTKQGRHVIDVRIDSQLKDGTEVSVTRPLTFHVGDVSAAEQSGTGHDSESGSGGDEARSRDDRGDRGDRGDDADRDGAARSSSSARPSASASAERGRDGQRDGQRQDADTNQASDSQASDADNEGGISTGILALIIGLFVVAVGLLVAAILVRRRRLRDAVMTEESDDER